MRWYELKWKGIRGNDMKQRLNRMKKNETRLKW